MDGARLAGSLAGSRQALAWRLHGTPLCRRCRRLVHPLGTSEGLHSTPKPGLHSTPQLHLHSTPQPRRRVLGDGSRLPASGSRVAVHARLWRHGACEDLAFCLHDLVLGLRRLRLCPTLLPFRHQLRQRPLPVRREERVGKREARQERVGSRDGDRIRIRSALRKQGAPASCWRRAWMHVDQ